MAKKQSNASDEQAPAVNEPVVADAGMLSEKAVIAVVAKDLAENGSSYANRLNKPRLPKIGDSILYTLGERSRHVGQERCATITKVIKAEDNIVQFNVHCATPDDFARNPNVPNWPVAPNTAPYDRTGRPGTWRYLDEEVVKAA